MSVWFAGGLVFFTSGAVLVLEILAVRLLAPYVGLTLEAYTAVIGTMLAGIAAGTWIGGYLADHLDPRRMLGPLLVGGGLLSLTVVPLVRWLGEAVSGDTAAAAVTVSVFAFFAPSAVLSAVSPTVVKLQLRDLQVTGSVVGRLSAIGTTGAIVGTFLAGFVLIDLAPTTTTVLVLGGVFVVAGILVWLRLAGTTSRGATSRGVATVAVAALFATGLGAAAGSRCDTETTYHCVDVMEDEQNPGGRLLVLDTLRHSYVDLDDPTHLEFRYTKLFADAVDALAPPGAINVLHVGGGGFTLPRYITATRPGSTNRVLEIDPGLVEVARERLGLATGAAIQVRTGDARLLVDDVPQGAHDVVLGDAFGGLAVPWHLTTIEFVRAVKATLAPGGIYVLNVIDRPPQRFAKAEAATLLEVFEEVAVLAPRPYFESRAGGNFVLVAGDGPLDGAAINAKIRSRISDEQVRTGAEVRAFIGDAPVLTDDRAPVDQWLARARE